MEPSDKKKDHDNHFDGFSIEEIEENFKNIAQEIKFDQGQNIKDLVDDVSENIEIPYFRDYTPKIEEYLARAKTEKECLEIIDYCLAQNEISENEALKLKERLSRGGPRAFGNRDWGYYTSYNKR